MAKKRNLFDELTDGVAAMKAHRTGKITLGRYKSSRPRCPLRRTGQKWRKRWPMPPGGE
jgi:hypothetical protein